MGVPSAAPNPGGAEPPGRHEGANESSRRTDSAQQLVIGLVAGDPLRVRAERRGRSGAALSAAARGAVVVAEGDCGAEPGAAHFAATFQVGNGRGRLGSSNSAAVPGERPTPRGTAWG